MGVGLEKRYLCKRLKENTYFLMDNSKTTTATARGEGRGAGASVRRGYKLFAISFVNVQRSVWAPALLFALMCGVLGCIGVSVLPRLWAAYVASGQVPAANAWVGWPLWAALAAIVVGGVAEVATYGNTLSLLAGHKADGSVARPRRWVSLDLHFLWRTVKGVLALLAVLIVWAAVVAGLFLLLRATGLWAKSPVVSGVGFGLVALALGLLLLPLPYVFMSYLLTPGSRLWPSLVRGFRVGFRHYGFLFVVCVFCAVVSLLVAYVLAQPAVVLGLANMQSQLGVAMGDAAGMPSYVGWLSFVVFTLAGLVMIGVRLSMLFPLYCMAASIDKAEEERAKYKQENDMEA